MPRRNRPAHQQRRTQQYEAGGDEAKGQALEAQQRQAQGLIQRKTIDAYALEAADATLNYFRTIDRLAQACNRGIVLKYEDMIYDWEKFSSGLTRYLDLDPIVLHQIYERSRPLEREDLTSHRRAGNSSYRRDGSTKTSPAARNNHLKRAQAIGTGAA